MKKTIAYDTDLKRPGCALVQAALGATIDALEPLFPAETWLTCPTENMRVYAATEEELRRLSEITIANHRKKDDAKPTR